MTPEEAAVASADAVSHLTARFMLDAATYGYGNSLGFEGMSFYAAGRGGVLGDVDAKALCDAFVFFNPELLSANWDGSADVMSREKAALEFAGCGAKWAEDHIPDDIDCTTLASLAEKVAAAATPKNAPVFEGYRALPAPSSPKAAAAHHMNSLRELRFALHANAVLAQGIDPEQALRHRQPHMVPIFGWDPAGQALDITADWDKAEAETTAGMAEALSALSSDELDTFVALANATYAATAQLRLADYLFRLAQWVERAGTVGPSNAVARRFRAFGKGSALVFPPGALFGEQFIEIGEHTLIGPYVTMSAGLLGEALTTSSGWSLRFGDNCSIGRNSFFVSRVGIDVGDDVTMGPNVYVTDHNHRYDDVALPIKQQWMSEAPVTIGPGCWLGAGVVILPGAQLGRNVVVGAGSVVRAGVVPDFSVVAGVPAKVVRSHDETGWQPPIT